MVANGDEMEPGTFKDRLLMEGNPHQLLEGVLLAAYAIEAELRLCLHPLGLPGRLPATSPAAAEAREAGYIGDNILGSGFNLEFHVHGSAGRYMCGEETGAAELAAGRPASPRAKPPFPPVVGLYGKPTIVQNIETLCNVPHIIRNGADWFRGLGLTEDGGTKLYGVSGKVKQPRHLRAAHGHPDQGDHRGARRGDARRTTAQRPVCPAAHRPHFSSKSTWICRWTSATSRTPAAGSAPAP